MFFQSASAVKSNFSFFLSYRGITHSAKVQLSSEIMFLGAPKIHSTIEHVKCAGLFHILFRFWFSRAKGGDLYCFVLWLEESL